MRKHVGSNISRTGRAQLAALRRLAGTLLAASLAVTGATSLRAAAPSSPQGVITVREYLDIGGGVAITDLTGNAKFPDNPDIVEYSPRFEWPTGPDDFTNPPGDVKDNYGVQIIGYLHPPTTGEYVFYITSDDAGQLFLSTDEDPANKELIAIEPTWNPVRAWDSTTRRALVDVGTPNERYQNVSRPIQLESGRAYYIEALMKEGGGGDNLGVAWMTPESFFPPFANDPPIPGEFLSTIDKTFGPATIVEQPADVSVEENGTAVFSVEADGTPPYTYQWLRDGTEITGETGATLTISPATVADSGAVFSVRVTAAEGAAVTSSGATLTVTTDTTGPSLVSAQGSGSFNRVTVVFDEEVEDASATTASNYSLSGGLTISSATKTGPATVALTTSQQAENTEYTLTVNNVQDVSAAGNTVAADSQVTFTSFAFSPGFMLAEYYEGTGGTSVENDLFNDPNYPDSPTTVQFRPNYSSQDGFGDNYGVRVSGFFIPQVSGDYVFFISGDDNCHLYLSTDDTPANKKLIAIEPTWNGLRQWLVTTRRDPTFPENRSDNYLGEWPDFDPFTGGAKITLEAGQRYYTEALMKEGGGGDRVGVTAKLASEPDPANGSPELSGPVIGAFTDPTGVSLNITQQPSDAAVGEARTATFTVAAEATPAGTPVSYQWQVDGENIVGATGASYTTPLVQLSDDGKVYTVVVSTLGGVSETSAGATLTVSSDSTPPEVVSTGHIDGTSAVGVRFNERLDQASAETASNYTVSGATVTSAELLGANSDLVKLTLSGSPSAGFTVTVNNVADFAGNAMASTTVDGQIVDMTAEDVGFIGSDPIVEGEAVAFGEGAFWIGGGGNDIWDADDAFHYVHTQFTGAFDMRARVDSLVGGDEWAKATLMARESLEPGSRNQAVLITKPAPYEGNDFAAANKSVGGVNVYNHQWRDSTDGTSASKPGGERISPTVFPSWIRLVRADASSNEMQSFISYDGQDWIDYHTYSVPGDVLPETLFVGMGVTSHDNGATHPRGEALYSFFSVQPFQEVTDPNVSISMEGDQIVIRWDTGTLSSSGSVTGPFSPVAGATSPHSVSPSGDAMFFLIEQ